MRGITWLVAVSFFLSATTVSAQAWERYEVTDAMRGEMTKGAALTVKALGDSPVSLTMHVIDKGEKAQAPVLTVSEDRVSCGEPICEISVRFGVGSVMTERMSVSGDGKTVIPNQSSAFAGSVALSKEVFVELPLTTGGRTQFRFEIDEPAFNRVKNPGFSFMGVSLGDGASSLGSEFLRVDSSPSVECREAKNLSGAVPGVVISAARMCFYNDMLYMVFIESQGKKESDAIAKYLTASFGKKDPESLFPSWPADTGKVIDLYTASATFWPDSKNTNTGKYMIFDESITSLVPK